MNSNAGCVKSKDCSGWYDVYYPNFSNLLTYTLPSEGLKKNKQVTLIPTGINTNYFFGRPIVKPTTGNGTANATEPKIEFNFLTPSNQKTTKISSLEINRSTGVIMGTMLGGASGVPIPVKVIVTYTDPIRYKIYQVVELKFY